MSLVKNEMGISGHDWRKTRCVRDIKTNFRHKTNQLTHSSIYKGEEGEKGKEKGKKRKKTKT